MKGLLFIGPVTAVKNDTNIYTIEGFDIYNPDDEEWEFSPGTKVIVEDKKLSRGIFKVAVKEFKE